MGWPDSERVTPGIRDMLRVNMGLADGEKLLVVNDVPGPSLWTELSDDELMRASERSVLARMIARIAREAYPGCDADLHTYPATGRHGREPDEETARRMRTAGVVVALTTYSLSHTDAREGATQAGARIASMPGFEPEMFLPDGPMAVDYELVSKDTARIAELLTNASAVAVRCPAGTDIMFSLVGRPGQADDGIYSARSAWGNLPAGEAYTVPVEGSAEGRVTVVAGAGEGVAENMVLVFRNGSVCEIEGGGETGEHLRRLMDFGSDADEPRRRRNLAELGVGTNPNATSPVNTLEAEKIKGTVHLAVGDNAHMGGTVSCDLHEDFIIHRPDLALDGRQVIAGGRWVFD
jgi:leucyl aminopeptidase (aminopeptidase T)